MGIIDLNDNVRIDLNLATIFLAIWEERSVSRAALRLNLSQSAVSGSLSRLRQVTADPLFMRKHASMEPTPRAIEMAPVLEATLVQMREALMGRQAFDPAVAARSFSIGMSDDFMLACGPALARVVVVRAPHVSLIFRQCNSQTVAEMLEARQIDVAMVAGQRSSSKIMHEDIGASDYGCLVDPAAIGEALPLTLDAYLRVPHVLVSYSGRNGIVDLALAGLGRDRRVVAALTQFAALPSFLLGSSAVATLPRHAAAALSKSTSLRAIPAPLALGGFRVSLAWRRDMETDPANQWIRALLRDTWSECAEDAGPPRAIDARS